MSASVMSRNFHGLAPYGLRPYDLTPYGLAPYDLDPYGLTPQCLTNATLPALPTSRRKIHIPKETHAKGINIYAPMVVALKISGDD